MAMTRCEPYSIWSSHHRKPSQRARKRGHSWQYRRLWPDDGAGEHLRLNDQQFLQLSVMADNDIMVLTLMKSSVKLV
ncbi:hypothetical protein ACFLWC_07570 [Chloroflexota bacterium]